MNLSSYEWHYYIGGDCGLKHRKLHKPIAYIYHRVQGQYEAVIVRHTNWWGEITDEFSLGTFDSPEEAQQIIQQVLEQKDEWG